MAGSGSKAPSLVENLLTGGVRLDDDDERRRRIVMVNVISLVAVVNLVPLGVAAHLTGKPALGVFDHVVGLVILINMLRMRWTGDYLTSALFGVVFAGALFIYLLATGGVQGTGHLWSYTFPLFAAFLLGSRGGAVATLCLSVPMVGLLILGHMSDLVPASYSPAFIARFLPSFLVVFAYSYTFERMREKNHRALSTRNLQLASVVQALQEKETALERAQDELEARVRARTADLDQANRDLVREVQVRKAAEVRLKQAHDRFTTVLESIEANVFVAGLESHEILYMNRHIQNAVGGDCVGQKCYEAIRGEREPCDDCSNERLLDEKGVPTGVYAWEGRNRLTKRWYMHYDRAVRWVDGRLVRIQIATDTTRRRQAEKENIRLQKQLLHSQKMEALGSMAGGVAHDLNNLLSSIVGYPDLILRDLPPDSPAREPVSTMKRSGEKCAVIVQDLLTLARSAAPQRELVRLNDVVSEFLGSPEFGAIARDHSEVVVDCNLHPDLNLVFGSPVHLGKVLLNLVINAAEAMPDGGQIILSTMNRRLDRPLRGTTIAEPGDYVTLKVSDEGVGIEPEDIPRIFEPFYTRKSPGRSGTGLGMAIVWNTVREHGGHIDVRSRPGAGTTFSLFFPIAGAATAAPASEVNAAPQRGEGETILIVDDKPEQRELCTAMLNRLGYNPLAVSSGREALATLRDRAVDLVLLDMILDSEMDGLDTYRGMIELHPMQKALILSGYSESDRVREALSLGVGSYLSKPYGLDELAAAVRTELHR